MLPGYFRFSCTACLADKGVSPHPTTPPWGTGPPMGSSQAHSLEVPFLCPLPHLGALHCKTGAPYTPPTRRGQTGTQHGQAILALSGAAQTELPGGLITPTGLAAWPLGCKAATRSTEAAWTAQSEKTERSVFPGTNCSPGPGVSFSTNRPTVSGSSGPLVPNTDRHENRLPTLSTIPRPLLT